MTVMMVSTLYIPVSNPTDILSAFPKPVSK